MGRLSPALLALGLCGCALCAGKDDANGSYAVVTDCAGPTLVSSTLTISAQSGLAALSASSCSSRDGGHGLGSSDGGVGDAGEECSAVDLPSGCPEAVATGTAALGLPSQVRVKGTRQFELYGVVGGRTLDCGRDGFGDESLLFCRADGQLVCTAVVRRND